jgi:nitric oxide dioxygenase
MTMSNPLSAETIACVKATVPALAEHGAAVTAAMYARLFEDARIRALFNHSNQGEGGAQVNALAAAILGYARNIDNLAVLGPVVERIAQKHIGYHILPEHYPFVADALLGAIAEVLGAAATPMILAAWGEAYWFLADILQGRETIIRADIEATTGGWHGWRTFMVERRTDESSIITSFVLRPADGGPVIRHKPGQYLTLQLDRPGLTPLKRNYSISSGPDDRAYRISVKREPGGEGSNWLHDHVQVGDRIMLTPPAGDFFLADAPERAVVLLSGGVGLTPMVSIAEQIAAAHPGLETHYVHGTMNSATHALHADIRAVADRHGRMSLTVFYSDPEPADAAGITHDVDGMIDIAWLRANVPIDDADFYLCGPKPFLRALVGGLAAAEVPEERIHYEFFGPADALLAA